MERKLSKPVFLTAFGFMLAGVASAQQAPLGPAYQYEGKWMATVQTSATATPITTVATCANPIILEARDGTTLRRADGAVISILPVDASTFAWSENGRATIVTPASEGNFIALTHVDDSGRLDRGRIVSYLRCGTAGQTAATQICVAD
jgi:hypothetical protein